MSNGPKFWETFRGTKFYDSDVPRIARALERLAAIGEAVLVELEKEKAKDIEQHAATVDEPTSDG